MATPRQRQSFQNCNRAGLGGLLDYEFDGLARLVAHAIRQLFEGRVDALAGLRMPVQILGIDA